MKSGMTVELKSVGWATRIRATRRGYMVNHETIWQGGQDGERLLFYYGSSFGPHGRTIPRGVDLQSDSAAWLVEDLTSGQYDEYARVLAKGHKVL